MSSTSGFRKRTERCVCPAGAGGEDLVEPRVGADIFLWFLTVVVRIFADPEATGGEEEASTHQ